MTREEIISAWEFVEDGLPFDALVSKDNRVDMHELIHSTIEALSAEPCDDCISRKSVIDVLIRNRVHFCDMVRITSELKELPTVTPKPKMGRWIPVSERLPEPFSYVNCTCHSLVDDREDWVVETCYLPQPPDSPYSDWGNIQMLNWRECEVIAWMYRDIPEPYKGGE